MAAGHTRQTYGPKVSTTSMKRRVKSCRWSKLQPAVSPSAATSEVVPGRSVLEPERSARKHRGSRIVVTFGTRSDRAREMRGYRDLSFTEPHRLCCTILLGRPFGSASKGRSDNAGYINGMTQTSVG